MFRFMAMEGSGGGAHRLDSSSIPEKSKNNKRDCHPATRFYI